MKITKASRQWMQKLQDAKHLWTENEIKYFIKAIGHCGSEYKDFLKEEYFLNDIYNREITKEQMIKGITYLLSNSFKQNGELRKTNKLGIKELNILKDCIKVEWVALKEYGDFVYNYLAIYRYTDSKGNYFDATGTVYSLMEIVG